MKIFRVPVYRVVYDNYENFGSLKERYGSLRAIDSILVRKRLMGVTEILTGFCDIDMINRGYLKNGALDFYSRNPVKAEATGYHLVVFAEDLVQKNLVRPEELDAYFSQYENSNWKKVYDSMKILTKEEKKALKQKMYSIYSSKK